MLHKSFQSFPQLPLRPILIVPFLLQISVAVGLVGYLSFKNGQRAVNDLAGQLIDKANQQVSDHLNTYLALPRQLAQISRDAIANQELDLNNPITSGYYFGRQAKAFENITYVGYSLQDGRESGAGRWVQGIDLLLYENSSQGVASDYIADANGKRASLLQRYEFNPTTEQWYKDAVAAGQLIWSGIEAAEVGQVDGTVANEALKQQAEGGVAYYIAISAVTPLYDKNRQLLGVTSVDLALTSINEFLQQLKVSASGQVFIMERNGLLVGSSSQFPTLYKDNNQVQRFSALNSPDAQIRAVAKTLQDRFKTLEAIQSSQELEIVFDGQRRFVQVTPWRDKAGLDWLVVVMMPELDFMVQINANTRTTVILSLGALGAAILLGFYTSQWIARPILKLSHVATAIAAGDLDQTVKPAKVKELGLLGLAFNNMARQLRESFTALEKSNRELETVNEQLEKRVKERTNELKSAKEEAEAARAIADTANHAKSEFLANMSHELRTPLNGILGYAQILQRSKTIVEKDKKGIDVIHQCGSHLLTLINDVLDLSKIEARKLELQVNTFHFPSFLQSVVEICRIKAEQKGIEFYYQPDPNLPEGIKADEKRLRQVLLNLMGNAIKFTEQGHVAFSVKLQSQPASSPMLKVRFQIDDTGVGMLPEQLEKIFLPFEQVGETKKQTEGTGLGLSISQRIVALMGGEIQVTSQPGAGSTFWFEAEVQLAETWMEQSRKRQQGLVKGYEGKKCRILIVDDRWENRSVLVQLLEPIGFELIEASHGKEGLEQAIAHQPDLIMTDLAMPVMDGWALVQQLRQSPAWSGIIIASSASVFEMDRQRALAAGCDDFLPKPVEANELLKQLQSHLLLEWVYEAVEAETPVDSATNQSLTIPPAAELTALLKAVEHCRVVAIQAEAQRLKQLDAQYKAFADRVLALTDEFELEAIAQLITTNLP